jgi:hypothetical protein
MERSLTERCGGARAACFHCFNFGLSKSSLLRIRIFSTLVKRLLAEAAHLMESLLVVGTAHFLTFSFATFAKGKEITILVQMCSYV